MHTRTPQLTPAQGGTAGASADHSQTNQIATKLYKGSRIKPDQPTGPPTFL